jgi:rod shape-determining protein MreD
MIFVKEETRFKILNSIPLLILFYIAFNGSSTIGFKFITINIQYILVYYWTLRKPETLGFGFIFLAGLVNDVIFGSPLGINALTLLVIASVATYVRLVTVRITLINDWISFIPALLLANFTYFISLYFSSYSIDYFLLFLSSLFTFILYPILWVIFSLTQKLMRF